MMDGSAIQHENPERPAMIERRLRVLLLAEACNPRMISVPLVGYSQAAALRQLVDAHLVTHWRNGPDLCDAAGWVEGRDFTAIDAERPAKLAWWLGETIAGKGKGWTLQAALFVPTYYYFEHQVWRTFGRRLAAGEFDLVHRLTPLTPTAPSTLAAKLKPIGVPFVIGPLNGGVPWPRQFDAERRKEREWLSYVRGAYRLLPGYRATRRDAAAILVASRDTLAQMPRDCRERCFYLPENAIDPARFGLRRTHRATRPIRVVFVGRLVPYKGADMLIEAVAPLAQSGDVILDVIGDGPMMGELKELLVRLGSPPNVTLHGWVEHGKVQEWLARSDVLAFPSVREFGGAVALEAMAVGVVPIVLDYGGPGELVTDKTGFRVQMGDREHIVRSFRAILAELAAHPEQIEDKGEAAFRRARQQFTWDTKARQTLEVYRWVMDPRGRPRPAFAMPVPDPDEGP
jgi:glycosyltransferase involved in cell wall biosynthesis